MTDNEIINSIVCCLNCDCANCSRNVQTEGYCLDIDYSAVLDLIVRQRTEINRQKAEIEKLKKPKENAKRIIEHCESFPICVGCSFALPSGDCVLEENVPVHWKLDDVKEEMVGEDNEMQNTEAD